MKDERDELEAIVQLVAEHARVYDVEPARRGRLAAKARRAFASPPSTRGAAWCWLRARYRAAEPALVMTGSTAYIAYCASVVWRYFA